MLKLCIIVGIADSECASCASVIKCALSWWKIGYLQDVGLWSLVSLLVNIIPFRTSGEFGVPSVTNSHQRR